MLTIQRLRDAVKSLSLGNVPTFRKRIGLLPVSVLQYISLLKKKTHTAFSVFELFFNLREHVICSNTCLIYSLTIHVYVAVIMEWMRKKGDRLIKVTMRDNSSNLR